MEYPLYIQGQHRGELSVTQEGLFTVLELRAEAIEGLIRVSVYGQGREAYLGLLQPWSGGLWLRRKFSRREMKELPEAIEYAAEAGALSSPAAAAEGTEPPAEKKAQDIPPEPKPVLKKALIQEVRHSPSDSGDIAGDELLWFERPDGTLCSFDERGSVIAIPAKLRRESPGAVLRRIGGREYMLFRY